MKRLFAAVLAVLILLTACSKPVEQESESTLDSSLSESESISESVSSESEAGSDTHLPENELNVLTDETRTMVDLIENFPVEFSSCDELDKADVSYYILWKIFYAGQFDEGENGYYCISETVALEYAKSLFSIDNMTFDSDPRTGAILFYGIGEPSVYKAEIFDTVRDGDTIICTAKVENTFTGIDIFMTDAERTRTFTYTFGINDSGISPVYLISSKQIK